MTLDFPALISSDTARFRATLADCPPDNPVPSCPEWTRDDLLWHLADVQWFWATIVADNLVTAQSVEDLAEPVRPSAAAALFAYFDRQSAALTAALSGTEPTSPRWMWVQDKALHTAGYIARRQAHEALIHRVDAEQTAGVDFAPIDPQFAADGVDEVVHVMYGREHAAVTFAPTAGRLVELRTTDTSHSWLLQLGRETGTNPSDGEPIDDANFRPVQTGSPIATVSGPAAELDLWMWNRLPTANLHRDGDTGALDALDDILRDGIN